MLPDYDDIRRRIPEQPKWFDNHGVPRYDEFKPDDVPNIYAREACLYLIRCQACHAKFKVSAHSDDYVRIIHKDINLSDQITNKFLHYGDPPRHNDCAGGDTMNCEDIRVLEYWRKERFDWVRMPEFEITLADADELLEVG